MSDASEVARKKQVPLETNQWYTARVDFAGDKIEVFLDDQPVLTATDNAHKAGLLGVYTSQGAAEFKQPVVRGREQPLDPPWRNTFGISVAGDVPHEQKLATILDVRALAKSRYIGWGSIGMAPNGDLIAVFSGDRSAHVSPDGKTQMIRSRDGGRTWSEVTTIQDLPIDDRDSGIIQTQKGTVLVSWFTGPPYHTELQGAYVIRSNDNGMTWGKPIRTHVSAPHGPIQLADGRLLYLGQQPHCSHVAPDNYNGPPAGSPYKVALDESTDDGKTWKILAEFPVPEDAKMLSFDEPHMVEAEPGRIVAMFRDCNPPDCLWQSESDDGGRTWTAPRRTNLQGHPPHLLKLANGWLLVVYAKRQSGPAQGQYACISRDGGRSWDVDGEIRLARSSDGDMGYPGSVQLPDGSIWTVFYQAERPGETPCLMGSHWRLKQE
jgi:hypothetical protein